MPVTRSGLDTAPPVGNEADEVFHDTLPIGEAISGVAQLEAITNALRSIAIGGDNWPRFAPDSESFTCFMNRLIDFLNANKLSEADAMRKLATLMPRGEEEALMRECITEDGATLKKIAKSFNEKYYTPARQAVGIAKLTALKQGAQTVHAFANTIRKVSGMAYPLATRESKETAMLTTLLQGLRPELKRAVIRSRAMDWKQAVAAAGEEEAIETSVEQPLQASLHAISAGLNALLKDDRRDYRSDNRRDYRSDNRRDQNSEERRDYRPDNRRDYRPDNRREYRQDNRRDHYRDDRRDYRQDNRRNQYEDDHHDSRTDARNNNKQKKKNWRRYRNTQRQEGNSRSSYRPRISPIIALVACLSIIGNVAATNVTHCSGRGGILLSLPAQEECTRMAPTKIIQTKIQLMAFNSTQEEIRAHRCSWEHYQRCTDSVLWFGSRNQTIKYIEATTEQECRRAAEGKTITAGPLRRSSSSEWTYDPAPTDYPEHSFFGSSCLTVKRFVMREGVISSMDQHLQTNLMLSNQNCTIQDGHCANKIVTLVWNPPAKQECRPLIQLGLHDAQLTEDSIIIQTTQTAFNIKKDGGKPKEQRCSPTQLFTTTTGVLFTLPELPYVKNLEDIWKQTGRQRRAARIDNFKTALQSGRLTTSDPITQYQERKRQNPSYNILTMDTETEIGYLLCVFNITEDNLSNEKRLHTLKDASLIIHITLRTVMMEAVQKQQKNLLFDIRKMRQETSAPQIDGMPNESKDDEEASRTTTRNYIRQLRHHYSQNCTRKTSGSLTSTNLGTQAGSLLTTKEETITRDRKESIANTTPTYNDVAAQEKYLMERTSSTWTQMRNWTDRGVNSKVQFAAEELQADMRNNFNTLFNTICKENNRQLLIFKALIAINPTQGMRALLGRSDVTARPVGPNIYLVSTCTTKIVKKIYTNHRVQTDECYAQTPVETEDGLLLFQDPVSSEATEVGQRISCDNVPEQVTFHDGHWTVHGQEVKIQRLNASHTGMDKLHRLDFTATSMFDGAAAPLLPYLMQLSMDTNVVAMEHHRYRLLHNDEATWKPNPNIWKDAAQLGGYVYNKTSGTVNEVLGEVRSAYGRMTILIIVAAPIALLAIIIGVYLYLRTTIGQLPMIAAVEYIMAPTEEEPSPSERYARQQEKFLPPRIPYVAAVLPSTGTVAAVCGSDLPYLPITIDNKTIVALLDSGAAISYMRETTYQELHRARLRGTKQKATAANGTTITFLGSTTLDISIGNNTIRHDFLVAEDRNCPAPLLIGYDIVTSLSRRNIPVTICPKNAHVKVGNTKVPLLTHGQSLHDFTLRGTAVFYANDATILPGQGKRIQIKADDETQRTIILTPKKTAGLRFPEAAYQFRKEEPTFVNVYNVTRQPIHVYQSSPLGQGRLLKETDEEILDPLVEYVPEEADWEAKLPDPPKNYGQLVKQLRPEEWNLDEEQTEELKEVILNNLQTFYNHDGKLGRFNGPIQHDIPLRTDMDLPTPRRYRIPLGKQEEVDRQVKELLKQGVIEPSTSNITSPVVLVKKKDLSWRFAVDYRQLNNVTRKQHNVIPTMSDIIDLAAGSQFFTTMDLASGFFQIPLKKEVRHLTAFATHRGLYQFCTMPMGLTGAPQTFQSVVQYVQTFITARTFVYLDDILLISETAEQHVHDIEELLRVLQTFGLKAKLEKCEFARTEVEFLGVIVGRDGVKPNSKKIKAIQELPPPTNTTALKSFLGATNYFRRFIAGYAQIACPLHTLTKKDEPYVWTSEHGKAFNDLKEALTTAPVLIGPIPGRPFRIESDASSIAIGAVLLQQKDDSAPFQAIAYASRKLNAAERRYAALETEALALVFALKEFRTYVLGGQIHAIVDHRPLTSLMNRRDLMGRLAKFQMIVAEYDITISYRPGTQNAVPDALSRYTSDETKDPKAKVNAIHISEVEEAQLSTPWITDAVELLLQPSESLQSEVRRKTSDRYDVSPDGLLTTRDGEDPGEARIILPKGHPITVKVIKEVHENPLLGAHLGINKTTELIQRRYTWTGIRDAVTKYISGCIACQRRDPSTEEQKVEPQGRMERFMYPGEAWSVDVLGPLPITQQEHRYVLVATDKMAKWKITEPTRDARASTLADTIINRLISKFGPPKEITVDNATTFRSEQFIKTMQHFGVKLRYCQAYHHESNGQAERENRTLEKTLSAFVNKTQSDWDDYLHLITFALNCVTNATTKTPPFLAMFGRMPPTPGPTNGNQLGFRWTCEEYLELLELRLDEVWSFIRKKIEAEEERRIMWTNKNRRTHNRQIAINDRILVRRAPPANKLAPILVGPFTVTRVDKYNVYYNGANGRTKSAHKNDVRTLPKEAVDKPVEAPAAAIDPVETAAEPTAGPAMESPAAETVDRPADDNGRPKRERRTPRRFQ